MFRMLDWWLVPPILLPLIREFAGQGSEARRVAPEVVSALEGAGIFRMLVPKRYGGMGARYVLLWR